DGAQPAGEGQAFFLVHRDLGDTLDLVFDGVFNGDDFVFVVLDLAQRRVESGGLAGASGPGDEHHAVGFGDVAAELRQVRGREADHIQRQLGEFLAHRLLIQHAEHGVFAVNGGHDGNAEVDQAVLVANAKTPVLWDALFGDVQL